MPDLTESAADGVVTLTLNRPESLNAISAEMTTLLVSALHRLSGDDSVGAIVLTGAGRGFCAGGDVKAMAARAEPGFEARLHDLRVKHEIIQRLRSIPKLVIAMINGPAFGAGLGIALACDLRVAARSARFGTAFANVGFSGDFGGTYHVTHLAGPTRARELYYLAEPIDAARAETLGLVNRVVDDESLLSETMALAHRIARGPRVAYGYMKRNLLAAETRPLPDVLELEALHQARTGLTEDHQEARRAFVEKRKPVFRGR